MGRIRQSAIAASPGRALALLLAGLATGAQAEQVAYDYARVVWVEPVTEEVVAPAPEPRCEPPVEQALGPLAAPGLADAIRAAAGTPAGRPNCVTRGPLRPAQRIVAYRVGYRYGGELYERTVAADPGERLRVRVSLRPAGP